MGSARVEAGERSRGVVIYGVNAEVPEVWKFAIGAGRFLPPLEAGRDAPLAVLGPKLKRELFGDRNALGSKVRIGGRRFLVIGVLRPKGMLLGFDLDDTAYVPVAAAQALFGRDELQEIDVLFDEGLSPAGVAEGVRAALLSRHGGNEDFTIYTQTEMLDTLGRILRVVSVAVGGIGAISLLVGAIGILTMMWISVNERTAEIGLLRALGLTRRQVQRVFLLEAALLSSAGGALGALVGLLLGQTLRLAADLPVESPPGMVPAALLFCTAIGLLSGILPARRAASLDPVQSLHAE
jgi:putative ABC transport system permease protein